ncbi:LamB/YcsF family protein [Desulfuribacillus alkaliarsenatis]|uniref:Lactam utilization protein LamB n=1 Tax=Desulfuribacillus alkaliarsenatis TaxID=766136 RepID=A0A1E5FYL6_9FIRM|nr:5-oxoprolinase subunit PxpA [Desulfuribacillus alkaliarsenatis]OEF95628.1 lactam utilization protein LamB [Desulfuribacillus alkaliarsenatis]
MSSIDINCDMGESYGIYSFGNDDEIFPYITSANIACGFHAGDYNVMAQTITKALENNVAIGAHPGYPDLIGFGRRHIPMTPREIYNMLVYQIGATQAMTKALGASLQHVKPHGALYNLAAVDKAVAKAIVEAVYDTTPESIIFGLANSILISTAEENGLRVGNEIFADRTYNADGTLTPRTEKNAIIVDAEAAILQCKAIIENQTLKADTICIHSDNRDAVIFAKSLNMGLINAGVKIQAIGNCSHE